MEERNSRSADVQHGRDETQPAHSLAGVAVREDDVEPAKAIRFIAILFRGMAVLMILLTVVQIISGVTGTVELSVGVLFAEAVRLLIFAGLLWGAGDLAVLAIKSHYDLRATRILAARSEYMMRLACVANGVIPPQDGRGERDT
ncbi:MAG: hypothetical protein V4550_17900 [Gemmatimonadota bacterium]